MWLALIATILIGALLYKFLFSKPNDYWKKLGILEIDTSPALGTLDMLLSRKDMSEADNYAYTQMGSTHKFCGITQMGTPLLVVKDEQLLKNILIKDFDHFADRRQFFSEEDGSLKYMLSSLEGDEWKGVRSSVSPTFTTGKIRRMMDIFNQIGKEWVEEFTVKAKISPNGSTVIDVHEAVNLYTLDVIFSAAFGIASCTIKNPDSTLAKMAKRMMDFNMWQIIKFQIREYFPKLFSILGLSPLDAEALSFLKSILTQTLKSRMSGQTKRNDFLQLLVEAKKEELKTTYSGDLNNFDKDIKMSQKLSKRQYLTDKVINAQSFEFFFEGFSNVSNFITFALYALALNPKVQQKLRQEVNKVIKEDGNLDYDDVGKLIYLDMVFCEVMRMFPAAARLERLCVKDYQDTESGLKIPKGMVVAIPLNSIHHDKKYYGDPDKFDPENFSPEKKVERSSCAYMPFGMGPRSCIGIRFAQIEGKSAIAHIIHNFNIEATEKTPVPFQGRPAGLAYLPPSNLELKFTPIMKHTI